MSVCTARWVSFQGEGGGEMIESLQRSRGEGEWGHLPPPHTYLAPPPPLGLIAHMPISSFRPLFFPKIPFLPPLKHNPRYATESWSKAGEYPPQIIHGHLLTSESTV